MTTNELKNLLTKYVSNPSKTQVFVNYDNSGPIVVGRLKGFQVHQDKIVFEADTHSETRDSMTVAEMISLLEGMIPGLLSRINSENEVPVFVIFEYHADYDDEGNVTELYNQGLDDLFFEILEVDFEMADEGEIILIGSEFDEE